MGETGQRRDEPALAFPSPPASPIEQRCRNLLELLREETGADLVYLCRFADGKQHLRIVVGEHPRLRLFEGATSPLEETYCWRVPQHIIPGWIPDSAADPRVAGLPGHREGGIGGYTSSPVYLADGQVYGTICCITHKAGSTPAGDGQARAEMIAALISHDLPRFEAERAGVEESRSRVASFLRGDGLQVVFQPIVDIETGAVAGYEALTRLEGPPDHGPDWWLQVAEGIGLGDELELAMFRAAAAEIAGGKLQRRVSLNVSPRLLTSPEFGREFERLAGHGTAIEITERAIVTDFASIRPALDRIRAAGSLIAADDAGAGFAGFRHLLDLQPDIIKLDISLTRDIDHDPSRQALAASLLAFGERIDVPLVVEGVETEAERATLVQAGFRYGQGYLFAHAAPLEATRRLDRAGSVTPRSR